jgi:gentisate 1,2-dioxygenase
MVTSEPVSMREAKANRAAFYAELGDEHLGALWTVLSEALTPEPRVRSVAYRWRYRDVRPRLLRAGELVSPAEAERRVLVLKNPGLDGAIAATGTLYAGIQLLLPGEVARTHHHTPSAIRFVIEGEGGYTSIDGERATMFPGDFLTTPNWMWHDHGNETDAPMMWLDGLDIPLVTALDAVFFEEYRERFGHEIQPTTRPEGDAAARWGSGLRPTFMAHEGLHSPVLNYPWNRARAALGALRDDGDSPYDGVVLEYTNPVTGGSVLPTMCAQLQLLRGGDHTASHRHVSSAVYHVAEGAGTSIVGGEALDWERGDTFVVPAWTWHEHVAEPEDAVLFSFSDRPVVEALGLERMETHPSTRQP